MKVLLIGSSGQLGTALIKSSCFPEDIELLRPQKNEFNLREKKQCYEYIINNRPDWTINSGAYTNVEKAENEKELALKINAECPGEIARAISKIDGKLLHISTDFIFDGRKNTPYSPKDKLSPINYYGFSKAQGEILIQNHLKAKNQLCILRTSWLMSSIGNNFATKIMKLLSKHDELKVVYDQIGAPTSAISLANVIWKIIQTNEFFSLKQINFPRISQYSDDGIASWYDVAVTLNEIGIELGILKKNTTIIPVKSEQYKTIAIRPHYSVLDSTETKIILHLKNIHWREALFNDFKNKIFNK